MEIFKLERPVPPTKKLEEVFLRIQMDDQLRSFIASCNEPDYLYWDKIKYKKPLPDNFTPGDAWQAVKINRQIRYQPSPIKIETGGFYKWIKLMEFEKFCHEFDLNTGGELLTSIGDLKKEEKQRLISQGIMDEAIASSQLEGADTGRGYARKMLKEGIRPRDTSEQMILNNHKAMLAIDTDYKGRELSLDLLLEMHALLTEKTLDSEGHRPEWRADSEPIEVHDSEFVYHKGPKIDFVKSEIKKLVAFANDPGEDYFIHPIIKATILHFWIGYLHPFTDGNGRLARLIFYWYLLKKNYWAFGYLPLSAKMKVAKMSYTMAYVYSEQDDSDLTYFISYLFRKIREANAEFQKYLMETRNVNNQMAKSARISLNVNERQIQLLRYLHGNKDNYTSIKSHSLINRIAKLTAINDLKGLVKKKLLTKKRVGRNTYYHGTKKIDELFSK